VSAPEADRAVPAALARSALLADALDALGLRTQCLGPGIAPLDPGSRIAGRALPVAVRPAAAVPAEPYEGLLAMLEAVRPGDVVVVATGRSDRAAVWGELTSSSCVARGAAGLVTDGRCRDVEQVRALGFPVAARGTSPLDVDGRGEFGPHGVRVEIDGVSIAPGDLVVADVDGVVVVPAAVAPDVLRRAAEKARGEEELRLAVLGGEPIGAAFRRLGVL
jgi:regulator of RNase E activity RraA